MFQRASATLGQPLFDLIQSAYGKIFATAFRGLSPADQKCLPQPCSICCRNIGAAVAHHHTGAEFHSKLTYTTAQHPGSRLAIFMIPLILADSMLRMKGTVIHRIQFYPFGTKCLLHPNHQGVKVRLGVEASRDPSLIRHHNQPIAQSSRGPAKRKYPVDKAHILNPV